MKTIKKIIKEVLKEQVPSYGGRSAEEHEWREKTEQIEKTAHDTLIALEALEEVVDLKGYSEEDMFRNIKLIIEDMIKNPEKWTGE